MEKIANPTMRLQLKKNKTLLSLTIILFYIDDFLWEVT